MELIKEKYNFLSSKFLNLTKTKYFNEIYAFTLALISLLGWKYNNNVSMIIMIALAIIVLILTTDLKYIIPNTIYFIFSIGEGFSNSQMPVHIIVLGGIFVITLLFFSIKNGIKLTKMRSLLGLAGLAITNIIPIIWCRNIPAGNEVMYFFFFGNLGYLILYIILVNGIKENSIDMLAVSMSYLIIILAGECAFKVYELKDTTDNILSLWYYMGWGLCNEAGIMICVSIPFVFYLMAKQEKISGIIFQNLKIIIAVVGILLTTSRGSFLFGYVMIIILYIVLLFISKNGRAYQNLFLIYSLIILILMVCFKNHIINFIDDLSKYIFNNKLDDNGRKEIWDMAYNHWNKNWLFKILGPGITCELQERATATGVQLTPLVFHSTFFQTLASSGIVGIIFLGIHFIQKYYNAYKIDKLFFVIVGIGYLIVDIYGMIDNTYHMYYYMIPLMVILAVVDSAISNKKINLN